MMHEPEKSDPAIVAAKPTNKAERSAGNAVWQSTHWTQRQARVSQAPERMRLALQRRHSGDGLTGFEPPEDDSSKQPSTAGEWTHNVRLSTISAPHANSAGISVRWTKRQLLCAASFWRARATFSSVAERTLSGWRKRRFAKHTLASHRSACRERPKSHNLRRVGAVRLG
jgi:hypothetical protein